jgi:hypothetical protein
MKAAIFSAASEATRYLSFYEIDIAVTSLDPFGNFLTFKN